MNTLNENLLGVAVLRRSIDCRASWGKFEPSDRLKYLPGPSTVTVTAHRPATGTLPTGDDWLVLLPPRDGARLAFQRSDATVTPWRHNARVHLHIAVPVLDAVHDHFVACGARPLTGTPTQEGHPDDLFRVYADPVGHALCAVQAAGDSG